MTHMWCGAGSSAEEAEEASASHSPAPAPAPAPPPAGPGAGPADWTHLARIALLALVACTCLKACLAEAQSDMFSLERERERESPSPRLHARSNGGQYCGSRLSEALKLLCNGQYNQYFKSKKSSPPTEEYWAPPVQLPFRDRLRAAAFLETRTRFTRGVFDECCSKSCSIDELMSYCAKPAEH